jgi:nitronate monooxygenase
VQVKIKKTGGKMGKRILKTPLCDQLGIEYPILSAGMGPTLIGENTGAPVDLVVAVSEAGGLGVLGGSGFTVDELREAIREIKKLTDKPYGVDLLLPKNIVKIPKGADAGPHEISISQALELMPQEHKDWLKKSQSRNGDSGRGYYGSDEYYHHAPR